MILNLSLLLLAFTVVYAILVLYMRKGWCAIPAVRDVARPVRRVSVIIAARNEELNIARTIESVLNQNFPQELLELIIIDDHSEDNTSAVVKEYMGNGSRVKLIQLQEKQRLNSYKKLAISKAISICSGDIIVTTDADCRMSNEWLSTVVGYFEAQDAYLLSSPVVYSEERTFFERLQTLEFLYLIGLGAAGIGVHRPTTCNGANLAYRKDIFFEMGGFAGIDELASGDDELLLHKIAERYPERIHFCKSAAAIVYTDAKPTLRSFISQRKRWASKSTKYKNKGVIALGVAIWLYNFLLLFSFLLSLIGVREYGALFLFSILIKGAVEYLFLQPIVQFVHRRELMKYLPILTVIHIFYLVYIGIMGNVGKYDWKGRSVH